MLYARLETAKNGHAPRAPADLLMLFCIHGSMDRIAPVAGLPIYIDRDDGTRMFSHPRSRVTFCLEWRMMRTNRSWSEVGKAKEHEPLVMYNPVTLPNVPYPVSPLHVTSPAWAAANPSPLANASI